MAVKRHPRLTTADDDSWATETKKPIGADVQQLAGRHTMLRRALPGQSLRGVDVHAIWMRAGSILMSAALAGAEMKTRADRSTVASLPVAQAVLAVGGVGGRG